MSQGALNALLVLGGMLMGLGLHEVAHMAWDQFQAWRLARKAGPQWFAPSDAPGRATPTAGGPQPTPRPVKGQRPAEGRHRPKQRDARFAGRVRRVKVALPVAKAGKPSSGSAPEVEVSAGQTED